MHVSMFSLCPHMEIKTGVEKGHSSSSCTNRFTDKGVDYKEES